LARLLLETGMMIGGPTKGIAMGALWSSSRRQVRQAARRSFKPCLDMLEDRITPSAQPWMDGPTGIANQLIAIGPGQVGANNPPSSPTDGITASTNHLQLQVGGPSGTYTIVLTSQPTADVTIAINQVLQQIGFTSAVQPAGSPIYATTARVWATPQSLTFTPADWSMPQTVSVSAPAGQDAPPKSTAYLADTITSTDPNYNGLATTPVAVDVAAPGLVLSTQTLWVNRDGTGDTFTLALGTRPADTVTVTIAQAPGGDALQITPATLTFTPANWSTPQMVAIGPPGTGIGNQMDSLTLSDSSTDSNYNNGASPVLIAFLTDPAAALAGIVVSTQSLTVTVGGRSANYTVALASRPAADVTVAVDQFTQGADLTVTPQTLTLTPDDWNEPQTVSVSAPADWSGGGSNNVDLANIVTSADPNYNNHSAPSVMVNVQSNPVYGLVISTTRLDLAPGETGIYTIALASQPAADVTVTMSTTGAYCFASPPAAPGQAVPAPAWINANTVTVAPGTLTFTPQNWNVAQVVNVATAANVSLFDSFPQIVHTVTSSDPNWSHISAPPVTVAITPQVVIGPIRVCPTVPIAVLPPIPIAVGPPIPIIVPIAIWLPLPGPVIGSGGVNAPPIAPSQHTVTVTGWSLGAQHRTVSATKTTKITASMPTKTTAAGPGKVSGPSTKVAKLTVITTTHIVGQIHH
jgi:hypothetical protein